MSNEQHMRLFTKSMEVETENGKIQTERSWALIKTRVSDGVYVDSNMDVVFSKAAREKFDRLARESKTKGTDMVDAKVTHSWIKAMVDREGKPVTDILGHVVNCVFVNDFEVWNKEKL